MNSLVALATDPAAWAALVTLIAMELVLAVDNLVFIAIITNKVAPHLQAQARRIGIGLALGLRLGLLGTVAWLVGLDEPLFGAFGFEFSWRDLILIAGGLFLVWKATKEIHHNVDPDPAPDIFDSQKPSLGFGSAIVQILLLDMVFSIDSILTAVGMTSNLTIMVIAVVVAVTAMMLAADPLSRFVQQNPTVVMLALGFLLIIGVTLIADGFGHHVPKGYIYTAMAFSAGVEFLNMLARKRRDRLKASSAASG
ncbi:MAG: TerC family protein [Alphaproteobacteria bacterium]|nr:TerC family protein [Alphaproteobacteria bacterium]